MYTEKAIQIIDFKSGSRKSYKLHINAAHVEIMDNGTTVFIRDRDSKDWWDEKHLSIYKHIEALEQAVLELVRSL